MKQEMLINVAQPEECRIAIVEDNVLEELYIERSSQTARILDVKYHILLPTPEHIGTPIDIAHWVAILTSCSGQEPFNKKVRHTLDVGAAVADFLILDPEFPRSVRYCLAHPRWRLSLQTHKLIGIP